MSMKLGGKNVILMMVFAAIGLIQFAENVRTVQVLGLFASGALFGVSMGMIITAFKTRQKKE
jgi:hypothetical protein